MRKLLGCLSLLLALALTVAATAEALMPEDVLSAWVEVSAEELETELYGIGDEGGEYEILAPEEATDVGNDAPAEPDAQGSGSQQGEALSPVVLSLSKNASKSVCLGVPYVIRVKSSDIKRVKSSAPKIATASSDGALQLLAKGKAKLTVKTADGKKLALTLTVLDPPAPRDAKLSVKNGVFKLKWSDADYATGYLVQYSADGSHWTDHVTLSPDQLSLNVSALVNGPTWFRVVAFLGDALGGSSEALSALGPVTDLKVICEESKKYGPTDHLNITWTASAGASSYEIYRAALPSDDYIKIGTTDKTWFADTRNATQLCAYRVKPICGELDLPMSDPATLWSGMEGNVLPPKDLESKSGIILLVNKKAQVVTAYIRDANGRYSLPLRHMICSTGRTYSRTRNGTYTLDRKKGEWYTYPGPSGDTIRWPAIYRSGYYFHSPLYNRNHTIRVHTVNRLCKRASAGCIRLKSNDAEWVYKNCVNGTPVYICDGKNIKALNQALLPKTVSVKGFK